VLYEQTIHMVSIDIQPLAVNTLWQWNLLMSTSQHQNSEVVKL